uniref:Putative ribonuclease H-like domain-containing protein n=1 Tax=Tanacetum cinerariifolium TaxID=118510 RepID=A0A699GUX8_TANCI|nr:putative ribonuclease H-like domain-containing protein [Tanacetum cinerariifolium]
MTPPPGFLTLTPIAGPNELPPITTSAFTAMIPKNTPLTHRASTSTNLNPMISPAFVENISVRSMMKKGKWNRGLETGRVERNFKGTRPSKFIAEAIKSQGMSLLSLLAANLGSENGQPLQSSLTSVYGGPQPSTNTGWNLPPNGTHLLHNAQPFLPSNLHPPNRLYTTLSREKAKVLKPSLLEFLSTTLPTTYKGLMEKTYTWIKAREVATNGAPNNRKESFDRLLSNLSKSPREHLAIEKVAKTFKQPPRLPRNKWSRDKTKYCHFHKDHGHDTNQCWELRHQIKEAVKSRQLAHLVKGIQKGKVKVLNTQLGRTAMQQMGIVVSTIHGAIKFHTRRRIGIVFLTRDSYKTGEEQEKLKETSHEGTKDIFSCIDIKERILINDKYLEQTIVKGKHLPTSTKMKIRDFLRANVFVWTLAYMTRIPRTMMNVPCTSEESISVMLLAERGKKQVLVYFVTQTLHGAGLEYPELEKLILALLYTARRLEDTSKGCNSIKGHILADFLDEKPFVKDRRMKIKETKGKEPRPENTWKLFIDGASSSDGSGAGLMLVNPEGKEYTYALRFEFKTTNNEAEYKAL